ncbi:hypothetical protein HZ992_22520 [Rhizobacter sp. AJA081-3]|uniref:hypothetical protein n=1 Tax=Rhizobacter sp. AJA081-3 TaxID=2753607 RepID=UPI001ADFF761|nr:hypothetical protein [Rhizobacter sp. AJA081-3]QTN22862.1 hypothetical protein HZ992_22520 [Rhizobacter sp. AJA081-3]
MTHPPLKRAARLALTALLSAMVLAPLSAQAQTWEYKSYKRSLGGQYNKENFVVGTIKLEEKDGKATFFTNAGVMDACRRAEVPAQVTRTDAEITIEPEISLAGCEKFRLVIRTDGSGGRRELWRNDKWVDSKWDHGLTPKQ